MKITSTIILLGQYQHDLDGGIVLENNLDRGALIYNIKGDCILSRMDSFLQPSSAIRNLSLSSEGTHIMGRQ